MVVPDYCIQLISDFKNILQLLLQHSICMQYFCCYCYAYDSLPVQITYMLVPKFSGKKHIQAYLQLKHTNLDQLKDACMG